MEMNERQKATYNLILENSKRGYITTKKEIVENYPFDINNRKDGYVWIENPKSHDNCSTVWGDINAINQNENCSIIISCNGNYWVGTKEEAEGYIKSYFYSQCRPSLKRYWNLVKKAENDGAMDIFTEVVKEVFVDDTNISLG